MPGQVKASVAFLVWVDHAEHLQRRPQLVGELTDPPHYQGDLVESDGPPGGASSNVVLFSTLDDALAWARASAHEVIVRPSWDPLVHYTATTGAPETWARRD